MVYIISELCGQWGGSVKRAEQMILQSKIAGADAVKVQLWDTYKLPGENREKWEYLSMTKDQLKRLYEFSQNLNIDFFASPFDEERFEWVLDLGLKTNKIASSMLKWDFDLCKRMVDSGLKTFISLGCWEDQKLPFDKSNVYYFHCIPKYPHEFEEAINQMPKKFDKNISGYSDHTIGIDACLEACNRGAKYIEKHYTINKGLQCQTESAHICSMEQKDLENLTQKLERS